MVQLSAKADWRVLDAQVVREHMSLADNKHRADGSGGDA
jgi:hypothetical protein